MSSESRRPVDEEQFIGEEVEAAPKLEPGYHCNARSFERIDDGPNRLTGYCSMRAGWGTDHVGEGRCRLHGGAIVGGGAPKGNQNPATHSLDADPHHHYHSLEPDEQAFIREVALAIEDRFRRLGDGIDSLDRVLARRVAVELHIVSKASDYIQNESGLIQQRGNITRKAALLGEVRKRDRDIVQMLREMRVLEFPEPESPDPLDAWRGFIE